jgi:Domain of unknown function (DUF4189)
MQRTLLLALGICAVLASAATPAFAEFGAFARDEASGKLGLSWGKETQKQADAAAMKDCGESSCKIVFRTHPHQCSAVATAEEGKAWGASDRGNRKEAVELAALSGCQKRTKGQCKVRASGCNR